MNKTGVSWADYTWNVTVGCDLVSQGCKNCYAMTLHNRRHKAFMNGAKLPHQYALAFTEAAYPMPPRLMDPLNASKKSTGAVFVCDMSDLFHESIPYSFLESVFDVMRIADNFTFLLLTKRPERMRHMLELKGCPPNVFLGVSVEDQATLKRSKVLEGYPNTYISFEPLLGPIGDFSAMPDVSGVIIGGESGDGLGIRWMHPRWPRTILDHCKSRGIKFYFKQWGAWVPQGLNEPGANEVIIDEDTTMYRAKQRRKETRELDGVFYTELPWQTKKDQIALAMEAQNVD